MLFPSAELSSTFPELEINLSDDYFNQPILENEYFLLNNAPNGMKIESVTYINASRATIYLSGNTDNSNEVSVTVKAEILNSYDDITTNELSLDAIFTLFERPQVVLYSTQNTLHLKCSNPELLGNKVDIFNLAGQKIITAKIEKIPLNHIDVNIKRGMYLCRFLIDDKLQTRQIVFVK